MLSVEGEPDLAIEGASSKLIPAFAFTELNIKLVIGGDVDNYSLT
jgi:hypothetical protein